MRAVILLMSDQQQHLSEDKDAQNLIQIVICNLQKSENFLARRRLSGHPSRPLQDCWTLPGTGQKYGYISKPRRPEKR